MSFSLIHAKQWTARGATATPIYLANTAYPQMLAITSIRLADSRVGFGGYVSFHEQPLRFTTLRLLTSLNYRYIAYYVPCITWIQQYKWNMLQGDLISALTMSSFYLPMALSYASNLAHVPPIHGLYAFVFNPFIYAIFGSCPQMVVGPEAAGSLLVGAAIKSSVDAGHGKHDVDAIQSMICGIVTGMAGAMVLIAGLVRLGFLDSVLSRPFLRGFISAIGFVIAVDQLIPELGLSALAEEKGITHGSSVDKIKFMIENARHAHLPTFAIAGISFLIIMAARYVIVDI